VAYLAEARQREFGVRLALGATSSDLIRRAMSTTLIPIGLGSACGLMAAAIIARFVSALLVGISPLDPLSYAAVGTLMIGSAVLAGLLAAWRLRGLSPSTAFRSE
jgi:ABC-type antimicrobial peptide transport system permease subunit